MLKSEGRASSSFEIIVAYQNTGVEMGPNHHGFCGSVCFENMATLLIWRKM